MPSFDGRETPDLSTGWIAKLIALAIPIPGQYAEIEDYTEYLKAAGILGEVNGVDPDGNEEYGEGINSAATGVAGLVQAGVYAELGAGVFTETLTGGTYPKR